MSTTNSPVKGEANEDGSQGIFAQRDVLDKSAIVKRAAEGQKGSINDPFYSSEMFHKILHKDKVEEYMDTTNLEWVELPNSVNGTLIYFILVELNHPNFDVEEFFESLFFVGFPVFFTFVVQGLLLYNLWLAVPDMATDANICNTGALVQHAVLGVFGVFLLPSISAVIVETLAILRCDECCFAHHAPEKCCIYSLHNSTLKKILTFSVIVVPETLILASLLYVGPGFILTSKDMGTIIINSVAIAFIMDIDNFCVEAFQSEEVSDRASKTKFKIDWVKEETEFSKGEPHDLSTPEALEKYYITIKSFSNVHKVVAVMIISAIVVFVIRTTFCIGDVNIAGDDIPVGQ